MAFLILVSIGQFFWSTFWGIIFYYFGLVLLNKIALVVGIAVMVMLAFETAKLFLYPNKFSPRAVK